MESLSELQPEHPDAVQAMRAALQHDRLHHAYALTGGRPHGAARVAMAFTAALVCPNANGGDGCGECKQCRKAASGNHPDVIVVTPDEKGVIRIAAVRDLTHRLSLKATESRYKVVQVRNAERMNPAAQNALLKTLEEPPGPSVFILTAQGFRSLLPTVRSRVQRLRLRPPTLADASERLRQGGIDGALVPVLAALGSDDREAAQTRIDQGVHEIAAAIQELAHSNHSAGQLSALAQDLGSSAERAALTRELLQIFVRDALALSHGGEGILLQAFPPARLPRIRHASDRLMQWQRASHFNANRSLRLEGVLMALGGYLQP